MRSVLTFLEKSAKNNRLAHAYLFAGSEYIDKLAVVQKFIKIFHPSGGHPQGESFDLFDYLFIEPLVIEKKEVHPPVNRIPSQNKNQAHTFGGGVKKVSEINIEQIRDLQYRLSLSPLKSPYQVAIINQADKMTKEAANALLKTLEEPSPKAILILITSSLNSILPTIQSRCQIIKFPAPSISVFRKPEFLGKYNTAVRELNNLIKSDLIAKYKYAESLSKDAGLGREQLGFWLIAIRDAILSKIDCQRFAVSDFSTSPGISSSILFATNYSLNQLNKIAKKIKETDNLLSNSSINARLALEVLMLEF